MFRLVCVLLVSSAVGVAIREQSMQERSAALAQTWGRALDGDGADPKATPVTRAVNLLKEMSVTLGKDMAEDEELYGKLACWCRDNDLAKTTAIKDSNTKIAALEATIQQLTATSGNLKIKIAQLDKEVADNKDTLAKATSLRKKELAAFNANELDATTSIANLKSAIHVLGKHHGAALPQLNAVAMSFLQSGSKKDEPWGLESQDQRDLDMFMSDNDFSNSGEDVKPEGGFLQQTAPEPKVQNTPSDDDQWTFSDVNAVQSALKSASSFVQRRGQDASNVLDLPGVKQGAQSGEIFGILRQLKEDMESDLAESQKTEAKRASDFSDLRKAKTAEIEGGWKSSEQKEDEKAKCDNDLAEAKEDLGQTQATLAEDTKFLKNLKATCSEADANFAKRKTARQAEMKAVSDTIAILNEDKAKNAMQGTFNKKKGAAPAPAPAALKFIQLGSQSQSRRSRAAALLRRQAEESDNPEIALIASSAELDAFTKVKAMIDKMTSTLTIQQRDEVKKNDFCKDTLQANDMATLKAKDLKEDLEANAAAIKVAIKTLNEEIAAAKTAISKEQVSLQKATAQRKTENLDFQKTVADQTLTIQVLNKAMDRLATYYDDAAFIQTHESHEQTPPVAQATYKASAGSTGVLSLIEKLIYDAKEIMADSKKAEAAAQAAYEALVKDSNDTIKSLTATVLGKTDAKVEANKDLTQKNLDIKATTKELARLAATDADLHKDCDFVLKNFMVRQQARSEEMESLRQAKLILSGAAA